MGKSWEHFLTELMLGRGCPAAPMPYNGRSASVASLVANARTTALTHVWSEAKAIRVERWGSPVVRKVALFSRASISFAWSNV